MAPAKQGLTEIYNRVNDTDVSEETKELRRYPPDIVAGARYNRYVRVPSGDDPEATMPELSGENGRWMVLTETSCYLLDLDARLVTRVPDAGLGGPVDPPVPVAALRKDHTPVPLLSIEQCRLGKPMILLLDARGDGVSTLRHTTVVREIRRVGAAATNMP